MGFGRCRRQRFTVAAALYRQLLSMPKYEAWQLSGQSPKAATKQGEGVPVDVFGVAWSAVGWGYGDGCRPKPR